MRKPRIAIATCIGYEDLKGDDRLLRKMLESRGAEVESVFWDDRRIDWRDFDLCLIRSTWDYDYKRQQFVEWARRVEAESSLRNSAELVAWNSEKTYLRELGEKGVPVIPTEWLEPEAEIDVETLLAEREWEEAVIKPVVDLGARHLRRVRTEDEKAQAALEETLPRGGAMVQPFLPSLETDGELSLVFVAGEFSHAVRKRPHRNDFRVQSIWGGTVAREAPGEAELELADLTLAQLDEVPLYARVDLVAGVEGELCLIELELIEPNLYLSEHATVASMLAKAALLGVDVDADRDVLE
jgi:glutathione synthase/RimK-type ligase-like ATP-grasp enzyme